MQLRHISDCWDWGYIKKKRKKKVIPQCMRDCWDWRLKKKEEVITKCVRIQGIEPWSVPWEGTMIPLHQMRFLLAHLYFA